MLFDPRLRTDPTESSGLESTFDFLDRVASPFFEQVREALNRWVSAYPSTERDELIARMRASSSAFRDAFWELWLYTAYVGAGFDVEIHPTIPGTRNQPDFAVSRGTFTAYLEARVATGASAESVARENLKLGLYKAFNAGDHRDFRLSLSIATEGRGQPSAKALRGGVLAWLDTLDADEVARDGQPFPTHVAAVGGWTFEFTALPLAADRRGASKAPLLSVLPGGSFVGDSSAAFRKALERKGRRYGASVDPLIVAIQTEELWTHRGDLESALFGRTSQRGELIGGQLVMSDLTRKSDGYWSESSGQRVAAVLTAEHVQPWAVIRPRPLLWLNPQRATALDHPDIWPKGALADDRLAVTWTPPDEFAPDHWFGVPRGWPDGVPFQT